MPSNSSPLLDVQGLRMYYPVLQGVFRQKVAEVRAVDGVSFQIGKAQTLGIVGESGSGKTTLAKCIIRALRPTAGKIMFKGTDLCELEGEQLRSIRKDIQLIFQDPYTSLNPLMKVGDIVAEPLKVHGVAKDKKHLRDEVAQTLALVQLNSDMMVRYPHQLSGGQRQRVAIARALILHPELIICDEPLSALDMFTQSRVAEILVDLQEKFSLSYLFISHDIAAVKYMSDMVGVMYVGELVEFARAENFFANPLHPYSQALIAAVPNAHPTLERSRDRVLVRGEPASPVNPPSGCRFHPRCGHYMPGKCDQERPTAIPVKEQGLVRCHLYSQESADN